MSWSVSARILHSEKSMYRNILVSEIDGKRCMVFGRFSRNRTLQSCFFTSNPEQLVFSYTRFVLAGFTQIPQPPKRILVLGLGGGTLPMTLEKLYPEADIDSVEIDPAVVSVAREWFNYQDSERQRVHTVDGRVFVKRQKMRNVKYDAIILDAFNGDYIPEHMMTVEYFRELAAIMNDNAILIANTFSTNRLYDHESTTYQAVFGDFYYLHSDQSGNRVIYANLSELNQYDSYAEVQKLKEQLRNLGVNFRSFNRLITNKPDWEADARILTDQYSPANLLKN
jgi:spermidine synthase